MRKANTGGRREQKRDQVVASDEQQQSTKQGKTTIQTLFLHQAIELIVHKNRTLSIRTTRSLYILYFCVDIGTLFCLRSALRILYTANTSHNSNMLIDLLAIHIHSFYTWE